MASDKPENRKCRDIIIIDSNSFSHVGLCKYATAAYFSYCKTSNKRRGHLLEASTRNCRHCQSMKLQVKVKSMNHRPAANCAPCHRRR